jgi:hypothetical protein
MRLRDVEAPTFTRHLACSRWWCGCQSYTPAAGWKVSGYIGNVDENMYHGAHEWPELEMRKKRQGLIQSGGPKDIQEGVTVRCQEDLRTNISFNTCIKNFFFFLHFIFQTAIRCAS